MSISYRVYIAPAQLFALNAIAEFNITQNYLNRGNNFRITNCEISHGESNINRADGCVAYTQKTYKPMLSSFQ